MAAAVLGTAAAVHYAYAGLTLTHYDARAHLVVARRVLDSLTPGWQQIGAVWLPLPHVLNMVPVQLDAWYRTGASGVAISVLSMALAAGSVASLVLRSTASVPAALAGACLVVLNPNVLYLQSTPMTEPLLFGLSLAAVNAAARWLSAGAAPMPHAAGLLLAGACLTRYEAWAITAGVVTLSCAVLLRKGLPPTEALRAGLRLSIWPALAVVLFSMNSRWVVGAWFVSGGFFVPENVEALGHPVAAWRQIDAGLEQLSGKALVWAGYAGAALVTLSFIRSRERSELLLVLALGAAAALPMIAYVQGHPFRIRYDLPLVIAAGAIAAAGIALLHRWLQLPVALLVVTAAVWQAPPFDRDAPLVRESQREVVAMAGRQTMTAYLNEHHDGRTIMMSMGSLAHYMHDLSRSGFRIKDFLHEGNGSLWRYAVLGPAGKAGWLIIEEKAEGGDALHQASKRARWLDGFDRVAEGGGAALYRAR